MKTAENGYDEIRQDQRSSTLLHPRRCEGYHNYHEHKLAHCYKMGFLLYCLVNIYLFPFVLG